MLYSITVEHGCDVRVTIKVCGKPQILATRPYVPKAQAIDLNFDTSDYVGGMNPQAKKCIKHEG